MTYSPVCPVPVERMTMRHRWDRLTFLHWSYPIEDVQRVLPDGLEVEPFDGKAWVGLVPFHMEVRPPKGPLVPWLLTFPETNVRTYARDANGEIGVWFFSLDATRLPAVATARTTYRVPYFWSEMTVVRHNDTMSYRTTRRWPGPRGATSKVIVDIGERYRAEELSDLDHYLTARWTLFGTWGKKLLMARAEHRPWELHRAEVSQCDDQLVAAAGLPQPSGEPVVHWSPGTDVRIGYPTVVR